MSIIKRFFHWILLVIIETVLVHSSTFSQTADDSVQFILETGGLIASGGNTPFWLVSNKNGTISPVSNNYWIRGNATASGSFSKLVKYNAGIDIFNRYASHNKAWFQQLYAGGSIGFLRIKGGLWEEQYGNQDRALSSGGMIWSGNARPMPRIALEFNDYIKIPLTHGWLEFRGGISHGWFEKNFYIKGVKLHHKYIYLRLGGTHNLHFEYGLQHFAQWGGTSNQYGKLPDDFNSFVKVFFGQGGGNNAPSNETINAFGNHVGSHSFTIDYVKNNTRGKFYWQNLFEDRSGMRLKNLPDGLWGLQLNFKKSAPIQSIVAEVVFTKDQSGKTQVHMIDSVIHEGTGVDNYFNNSVYGSGWTYKGMTIGTPFITSPVLLQSPNIINNRIFALHFGLEGDIKSVHYKILYSFSKNYATYSVPFASVKNQHSVLVQSSINKILPWNIITIIDFGIDTGELFGNTMGGSLRFRKEF